VSSEQANLGLATNKSIPQTIEVWHRRLGHRTLDQASIQYLQPRVSEFTIKRGTNDNGHSRICETCAIGRQHTEPITGTREKAKDLLEVVNSDICGPMQVSTIAGERYFITFIDEKSGRIAVTLLKTKSEALGAFQAYKVRAEKAAGREIKCLRTDGGGEFLAQQFKSYLRLCGIAHSVSPAYTPSHNGRAERANRTLMESARCMIEEAKLDNSFWGFAVATAAHIQNRLPSRSYQDLSPLTYWTGTQPSIGHLRTFGSVTHTLVPKEQRKKLDSRSTKCILIGYDEDAGSKVYRVYNPLTKRIHSSRNVIIDELDTIKTGSLESPPGNEIEVSLPEVEEKDNSSEGERQEGSVGEIIPEQTGSDEPNQEEFGGDTIVVRPPPGFFDARREAVSGNGLRRSQRQRNQDQHFSAQPWRAMLANLEEPQTLSEALAREDSEEWYAAWESEVDSLVRNSTWELTSLPEGRDPIGCRWLFKRKDDGRYKARLVAKGYSQREGLDYSETFAPVAKFNSLRSLLALVCENDWELAGMDVKTAFLHSELEETVYMEIPEGLHTEIQTQGLGAGIVCRLVKSIYGLKQSPRAWYGKINSFFLQHGFQRSEQDHSVYIHSFL